MRTVAETCPQPRSWFAGTRKPAAPALPPWSLLRGRSKQAAAGPARTDHRHAGSVAPQLPAQRTAGHLASPVCSSSPQQTSTMLLTRVSALIQVNPWQIWLFPGTRLRADPWPARAGNGACRRTRRSSGDLRVPPVWGHQHAATRRSESVAPVRIGQSMRAIAPYWKAASRKHLPAGHHGRRSTPWLWAVRWERALKNAWRRSASADLKRLYFEPDHRRDSKGRGRQ